jgi:NitT/TauT family transport system ATP-binding protein
MTSPESTSTSRAQPPFVKIDRVAKIYANDARIIEDLSLQAQHGEFISLIGPSGCGKSTLLRMIAGLSSLSSGEIRVDNMEPKNAREIISFVFQDATLLPWRTVKRNVELAMEFEGRTRAERAPRVAQMLNLVGLSEVAKSYPRQLSGGMKMRVSIARALATSPRLLLMDEPFGALDEISRNRLNEELLRLREEQKWTAFFVTHSVSEAVFLSSRILVMRARPGQIFEEIPISLPYPRTAALRSDPAFLKLVGEVSVSLRKTYQA